MPATAPAAPLPASDLPASAIVPQDRWGRDHWSTLLYIDCVMLECAGFQVGTDARMKSNRRHCRVLAQCPAPRRPRPSRVMGIPMRPEHASRDNLGQVIADHDDWCCVQDFAAAGLFTVGQEGVEPGQVLHWSDAGRDLAGRLRAFKAAGGQLAGFQLT